MIWERIKAFIISVIPFAWAYYVLTGRVSLIMAIVREIPWIGYAYSLIFGMPEGGGSEVSEDEVEEMVDEEIEEKTSEENPDKGGFLSKLSIPGRSDEESVEKEVKVYDEDRNEHILIYDPISNTCRGKDFDIDEISELEHDAYLWDYETQEEIDLHRTPDGEWFVKFGLERYNTENQGVGSKLSGITDKVPGLGGFLGGGGGGGSGSKASISTGKLLIGGLVLILLLVGYFTGVGGAVLGSLGILTNPIVLALLGVAGAAVFFYVGGVSSTVSLLSNHPLAALALIPVGIGVLVFMGLPVIADAAAGTPVGIWADYSYNVAGEQLSKISIEQHLFVVRQQMAKLGCVAEGPHCIREWQLNNTRRPDSRDVGETYGLEINDFRLGSGSQLDIRGLGKDYPVPLSFTINNIRNNHKGITARDVYYRVILTDSQRGEKLPHCDTGWIEIEGYDLRNVEGENHLPPGMAFSTGSARITERSQIDVGEDQQLTLENCKMLSPGAGDERNAKFYIKYNYSSQATLYFDATSRDYAQTENVEVDEKNSETADTPVKAALRVQDPVIFDTRSPANDRPVDIGATLITENFDLEYRVKDLELIKPLKTSLQQERWCSFRKKGSSGGQEVLVLDENASKQVIIGEMKENMWFSQKNPPRLFGCDLALDRENYTFNPSGETLSADLRTNYTVKKSKSIGSFFDSGFEVVNSRCTRLNCPVVVALNSLDNITDEHNLDKEVVVATEDLAKRGLVSSEAYWARQRAICDGPDAYDGCTAVSEYDPYLSPGDGKGIEKDQIAVNVTSEISETYLSCEANKFPKKSDKWGLAGFDVEDLEDVVVGGSKEITYSGGWVIQEASSC